LSSEKGLDLVAEVSREPLVIENLSGASSIDVVKEPRDVKQKEHSYMAHRAYGLDVVDQSGDGVHGSVVGPQPKLCRGDELVSFYVDVYPLGNNFFHQLASILQQADGLICLGEAVVRLIRFVKNDHYGVFPWMGPQV